MILFRCNSELTVCKQTYGYLAASSDSDSSKKYYSFDIKNNGKGQLLEVLNAKCSIDNDDIGKLLENGNLCIKSGNEHPMSSNGDIYSLSTNSDSVFCKKDNNRNDNNSNDNDSNNDESIIVRSTANAFYLDNYYREKGVNLFISLKRTEDTSQVNSNINNTQLCYCTEEGHCTAREGYIKSGNNNNYYAISTTMTNNKISSTSDFVNTCTSNNGWKLLSYGKLCLGKESIPFLTAGSSYYIGYESSSNSFFFIRAITNIFMKETLNGKIKIIKNFFLIIFYFFLLFVYIFFVL